ncbi:MAG: 16S rRNA (uracil(1498)-N(3))-methyltransferase [Bacteroidetes bacterium]|nr:16S rRNA (uracil(1498)-N(3))-methyltransferase [Bacteroidota bacterium]
MSLPIFFHPSEFKVGEVISLPEDSARHIVQVLRMNEGQPLRFTNGKGKEAFAIITETGKRKLSIKVSEIANHEVPTPKLILGVALTRNASRNEWLMEKATELGVHHIVPLICQRSEREQIKRERWQNILISALLQSQQFHLPTLFPPMPFNQFLEGYSQVPQKVICHCIESMPRVQLSAALKQRQDAVLMIGPEGDFTHEEVNDAEKLSYIGVQMVDQRLRTETAAMAAVVFFSLVFPKKIV